MTAHPVQIVAKAADFAARAHARQKRKDCETPYINHLAEVAWLLAEADCDANLVAAGYLHDAIEDVQVSYETLLVEFGEDIANLVQAVTDDKTLAKHVRKNLQLEHAPLAPARVANLKTADKISNLRSLLDAPPGWWTEAHKVQYIAWAHAVVTQLRSVHPSLLREYEVIRARLLAKHPSAVAADPVYTSEARA